MDITIDIKGGLPIYRQIANQIRYMVASGLLQPDEDLPPIRTLAPSCASLPTPWSRLTRNSKPLV